MLVKSSKKWRFLLLVFLAGILLLLILVLILPLKQRLNLILLFTRYRRIRKFIIAQSRFETSDFTTDIFRSQHNLFGMKNATAGRAKTQLGLPVTGNDFRFYKSWFESLRDYLQYLRFTDFPAYESDLSYFVNDLKSRGYFTVPSSQYYQNLTAYYS